MKKTAKKTIVPPAKKAKAKKEKLSVQDQIWGQYNPAPRTDILMYITKGMAIEDDPNEEKEFGLGEPQMTSNFKGDVRYIANRKEDKTTVKVVMRKAPEFGKQKEEK